MLGTAGKNSPISFRFVTKYFTFVGHYPGTGSPGMCLKGKDDQKTDNMRKTIYLPFIALALMATSCNTKKAAVPQGGIRVENLDKTANPRTDFYQYACGGWMAANPLTDEYSRFGSFDQLAENNRTQIKSLIEDLAHKQSEQIGRAHV